MISVLKTGEIQISRGSKEENCIVKEIVKSLLSDPEKINEIIDFLDEADSIVSIRGDRIFCG